MIPLLDREDTVSLSDILRFAVMVGGFLLLFAVLLYAWLAVWA